MNTGIGLMILGVIVAVAGVAGFGGYANRGFKLGARRSSLSPPNGGGESETPPVEEPTPPRKAPARAPRRKPSQARTEKRSTAAAGSSAPKASSPKNAATGAGVDTGPADATR
jgi:hypothetical protein